MIARHPNAIALVAGGISATGFAPLNLWPLTLLMLTLWMALVMQAQSRKAAFLTGWLFGLGHFIIGLNWIAKAFTFQAAMPEWLGYVAVVLLSLYLAVFSALAALGAHWLGKDRPGTFVLAMAAMWIVTEWLRSWVFSGFIWSPLGAIALPLGRMADLSMFVGSYGLSALLFAGAGGLWLLCRKRWKPAFPLIAIFAGLALIPHHQAAQVSPEQPLITVVQPNIGQQDKWKAGYEEQNLAKLAELTLRKDDSPRIIFWPEAAIPDYLETGYPARCVKLAAVLDRDKHYQGSGHTHPFHIYKLMFICERTGEATERCHDITDAAFFDLHDLPALSAHRTLPAHIELLHRHYLKPDLPTVFD